MNERLADVGAADDGDAQVVAGHVVLLGREDPDELVEQVAGVLSVLRRHGVRIARAELVELVEVRALGIVDLVGDHEPGLSGFAHELGDPRVARMHADLRIDDEQHQVGFLDGLLDLLANLEVHRERRIFAEAAGVDEPEGAAVPFGAREMAVARRARLVAHDGRVAADDAIEQRRLADVGPADDGDDGEAHAAPAVAVSSGDPSSSSTSMKS